MKKTIVTFIVFAFLANVSAQLKVNSSGSVGIGKANPTYKLDVVGNASIVGNTSITGNTSISGDVSVYGSMVSDRFRSSYYIAPITFTVNDTVAGFTGSPDIGYYTEHTNVSFGYGALSNPFLSQSRYGGNVAVGIRALYANRYGYYNTATGYQALFTNSEGTDNTAMGYQALYSNYSGNYNTAIGSEALSSSDDGWSNTAIGYQALYSNFRGCGNTAIGSGADVSFYGLYNATAIGNGAIATNSNQVRIGNSSVTSIGGYAPWSNLSDGRAKKNIQTNVPGLDFINRLQPVTYHLDLDAIDALLKMDKTKKNGITKELPQTLKDINKKAKEAKEKQIQTGFVAQDVEKVAKSIGYDFSGVEIDGLGVYGLRYSEFVVPLVKAVQELSEQNSQLQEQINELKGNSTLRSATDETEISEIVDPVVASCKLYQNAPNPFNKETQIKFYLPENVQVAQLCIYNLQGTQIKQIQIAQRGDGSQRISGSELVAGMYLYSLIADGKEVDTKRMVLTK